MKGTLYFCSRRRDLEAVLEALGGTQVDVGLDELLLLELAVHVAVPASEGSPEKFLVRDLQV